MENIDLYLNQGKDWSLQFITTPDNYVQGVIIAVAFVVSALLYKIFSSRIDRNIDKLKISFRLNEILHNLVLLIFPISALVLLFIAKLIVLSAGLSIGLTIMTAFMNLLGAWIVIRVLVQFIENKSLRNSVALSIWFIAALNILGVLDETSSTLDALGINIGEFRLSALTVTKGILALIALIYIANVISALVERQIKKSTALTMTTKVLINKVVKITLVTSAILVGVTTAGIDLSLLAVFSGAVGLGIGFGLQKVISNLFSGLLLLLDQSIKPGDIIELPNSDGTFGWVHQMGARYTEIVTRDNKSFLIPNEDFITHQVINWSHGDTLVRVEIKFGVSYQADPHLVRRVATEAAKRPERVVSEPSPVCHIVEFGDSSVNYTLRFWIKDAQKGVTNAKGDVMLALWDALKENDINIPYPHREVFIHQAPDTVPQAKKKATVKSTKKTQE